jgi:hypothetical protein
MPKRARSLSSRPRCWAGHIGLSRPTAGIIVRGTEPRDGGSRQLGQAPTRCFANSALNLTPHTQRVGCNLLKGKKLRSQKVEGKTGGRPIFSKLPGQTITSPLVHRNRSAMRECTLRFRGDRASMRRASQVPAALPGQRERENRREPVTGASRSQSLSGRSALVGGRGTCRSFISDQPNSNHPRAPVQGLWTRN